MKDIIWGNTPDLNFEFRSQVAAPKTQEKPKESTPKTPPKKEVKKVSAQSGLGGGKFNPNINMPNGGAKDD